MRLVNSIIESGNDFMLHARLLDKEGKLERVIIKRVFRFDISLEDFKKLVVAGRIVGYKFVEIDNLQDIVMADPSILEKDVDYLTNYHY